MFTYLIPLNQFYVFRLLPDNLQRLLNKVFYVNIIGFPKDVEMMKKYRRNEKQ